LTRPVVPGYSRSPSRPVSDVSGRLSPSHRRGGFGDDQTPAQPRRSLCPLRGGLQIVSIALDPPAAGSPRWSLERR
jgi:hypothetical protein